MSNDRKDRPVHNDRPSVAVDALIDDTAREMTAGLPSPALRERVCARLAPRRRPIWRPALAAAALAVLTFVLMPSGDEVPPAAPTAGEQARSGSSPPVTAAADIGEPAPVVVEQDTVRVPQRAATRAEAAAFATREDETMLAPLVIAPVPVLVATVEEIPGPMPLRIDGLEIPPLSIEE
jgi:hypothetical protein